MRKRMKWHCIVMSLMLVFPSSFCFSATHNKVEKWFNDMNYANATAPGIYKGQTARFATLGGLSTRAPVTRPFNLAKVTMPSFTAGCGGIDFFSGGFQAINANQFTDNLRSIGQNAISLAFMLAIQIVSPQLSGVMQNIQDFANKYLTMNMDSCEAAGELVGGALSFIDTEKSNCISERQTSYSEDFSTASYNCTSGGQRPSTNDKTSSKDKNSTSFIHGNLAWYVLMQDTFFSRDTTFAQLMMNITGTLILQDKNKKPDSGTNISYITPAIIDDVKTERFNNIYNALLNGTKAGNKSLRLYRCSNFEANDSGCPEVTGSPIRTRIDWTGLRSQVATILSSIAQKIPSDEELTNREKGLIASTSIPVFQYLSAATTSVPKTQLPALISKYEVLIANDILLKALNAIIQEISQGASMLKKGLADDPRVIAYRKDLQKVMNGLSHMEEANNKEANQYLQMQQEIQHYETLLFPKLSKQVSAAAAFHR